MKKFDLISVVGLLLALTAIVLGNYLEGGHFSSLVQFTAFVIVVGGTVGAVMLQSPLPTFLLGLKLLRWVFMPPEHDKEDSIRQLVAWSAAARRGGLLSLEAYVQDQSDPFLRKGLQMLVDGVEPKVLRASLETDTESWESRYRQAGRIWDAAGGYAPTIGILGAVLGLIHVMQNLSDPAKLGGGIAVAFVATVYGVGLANLVLLPIAGKLKAHITTQVALRDLLTDGLCGIASGDNPRMLETRLRGYLTPEAD